MKFRRVALGLLSTCFLAGCGGQHVKLVPVTGTVKIDGKPAANIMVMFAPSVVDESIVAPTSQAVTDDSGEFELYTSKNEQGAVEGMHFVSLFDTEEERPAQGEVSTKPLRLHPKFASRAITIEVVEGNPLVLEAAGP